MDFRQFRWSRDIITEGGEYPLLPNCFSWMAINIAGVGGATAYVDGWPLHAPLVAGANGEFHGVGGNSTGVIVAGDTSLKIYFEGAGESKLFLRQLYYIKNC